jgi:O-antigen ligase
VAASIGISYIQEIERFYIIGGIIGLVLAVTLFFKPELGAYLLIITVFSNMSDLFTESGLPSINKPLVALVMIVVVANLIFAPERLVPLNKISRVEWALLAYVLVVILSYGWAKDQELAYNAILRLVKNVVVLFTIFMTLNSRRKVRIAIRVLITTMTILVILGIIQNFIGSDFTFWGLAKRSTIGQATEQGTLRYAGPLGLSNVWGQVLVIVLPYFIYRAIGTKANTIQKLAMIFATFFTFLAILLTGSRGAFIGMLLVLPLIALELKIKTPTIFIGLAVATIIILVLPTEFTARFTTLVTGSGEAGGSLFQDEAVQGRVTKMKAGLAMFRDRPFFGVGVGNYPANYWDYADDLGFEPAATETQGEDGTRDPHSLYVEILSETGLAGAATFLIFIGFLLKDTYHVLTVSRGRLDDSRWKNWVAPVFFSLIAYVISAIFLHGIVFRWFYLVTALALSAIHLTEYQFKNT